MYLKEKIFSEELQSIKDENIKAFATYVVNHLPDYFFEVAASSTGKYHSDTCLGTGGLVRHTKAAVMFANSLFNDDSKNAGLKAFTFSAKEQSEIITALIAHDGWKHGLEQNKSNFTTFDHPLVAARQIIELSKAFAEQSGASSIDIIEMGTEIAALISSHMGRWTTNKRSKDVLPEPESEAQTFVHLCDYLASRSFLDFRFSKANIVEYKPEYFSAEQDLSSEIEEVISAGKRAIKNGVSSSKLYDTVYQIAGVKNPKRISDIDTLNAVKEAIDNLGK